MYFHVGSGRCGSTLIQALFNEKMMHDVFAQHKRKYDPNIYLDTGLISHDETFIKDHWRPIKEKYFAPMASQPFDGFFVTQENILGMRSEKNQRNICDVSCEKIAYLAEGMQVKVIIVLRRQDTYIESLYNQCVKRMETRDFDTFVADFPKENWHWIDNIDVYAKNFGRENVTIVPFESKVYEGADYTGFIDAILVAAGITTRITFNNLPLANPSMAPRALEVQRFANQHLTETEAHALANWFEGHIVKQPEDPHKLMSDQVRAEILDTFRESNRRLCSEYLAAYPAALAHYTSEAR